MGTNYYLHQSVCESCGRGDNELHIGKSSAGWAFALHVGDAGSGQPASVTEWMSVLSSPDGIIRDEYDCQVSLIELLRTMFHRAGGPKTKDADPANMGDSSRYDPDVNLWRASVASVNPRDYSATPIPGCTVDLCRGDFS